MCPPARSTYDSTRVQRGFLCTLTTLTTYNLTTPPLSPRGGALGRHFPSERPK